MARYVGLWWSDISKRSMDSVWKDWNHREIYPFSFLSHLKVGKSSSAVLYNSWTVSEYEFQSICNYPLASSLHCVAAISSYFSQKLPGCYGISLSCDMMIYCPNLERGPWTRCGRTRTPRQPMHGLYSILFFIKSKLPSVILYSSRTVSRHPSLLLCSPQL